jgi:hypothetical protein
LKPIGFIAASSAAYAVSFEAAAWGYLILSPRGSNGFNSGGSQPLDVPLPVPFLAGSLGAFIVFFSASALIGPANIVRRSTSRIVLWPLIGGVLAVVGWMAADAWPGKTGQTYQVLKVPTALYVIWQTGVALCIAVIAPAEERQTAPASGPVERSMAKKIVVGLLFAALFAFFGWQTYGHVQSERSRARSDAAREQLIAEAPSADALPPIEAVPPAQVVIAEDMGGYFAQRPSMQDMPGGPGSPGFGPSLPPHISYTAHYQRQKEPLFSDGAVVVTVDQYPDSAWARYMAKYRGPYISPFEASAIVTKFENRIYMDSAEWYGLRGGVLIFHWPSGGVAITIRYETNSAINDDFLKRYLEKYPSSL